MMMPRKLLHIYIFSASKSGITFIGISTVRAPMSQRLKVDDDAMKIIAH
jgi:hypothetical protein